MIYNQKNQFDCTKNKKRAKFRFEFSPKVFILAEKERFELSVQGYPNTRLAGEHLQPARSLLRLFFYGGGGRIRTHGASRLNGFQDRHFQPLSHSSELDPDFISSCHIQVNTKLVINRV